MVLVVLYYMRKRKKERRKIKKELRKKIGKITKDHINTKKGKFPETESLTHQVGPYVGDVGSEGKRVKKRKNGIPGA